MEDYQKITDQIIRDGFYRMSDNRKVIYDIDLYYQEQQKIMKKEFPDLSKDLSFAVFRAALYQWNLGKDLKTDYELFNLFRLNRDLNDLRSNTFTLPEKIGITSEDEDVLKKFTEDLVSPKKPFIISSFHYSSYKVLINYMVYHGFTIYLVTAKHIIDMNKKDSDFYVKAINQKLGLNSDVRYICAEDFNSMLILAETLSDKNINPKTVFLLFPDGNIGTIKGIDTKRFESIRFLNRNLWVRKGLFMFAELFNIPAYNILIDSDLENNINIEVTHYIDNPKLINKKENNLLILFYNVLENHLLCGNLHKWECWVYIHSWHEHQTPPSEDKVLVSLENYDEDRFTLTTINQDKYVFDSKYYLSYPIEWDGTGLFRDILIKANIIL